MEAASGRNIQFKEIGKFDDRAKSREINAFNSPSNWSLEFQRHWIHK